MNNDTYYTVLSHLVELYNLNVMDYDCLSKLQDCILNNLNNQLQFESEQRESIPRGSHKELRRPYSPYMSKAIKTVFR